MAGRDFDPLLPLQGAAPKSCQKGDMAGRDFDPLLPLRVRVVVGLVGWLAGGSKPKNRIP